jgi:hypothetical protein
VDVGRVSGVGGAGEASWRRSGQGEREGEREMGPSGAHTRVRERGKGRVAAAVQGKERRWLGQGNRGRRLGGLGQVARGIMGLIGQMASRLGFRFFLFF